MLIEDRYNIIIELVTKNRTASKKELAEKLGVSLETIRRDIEVLSQRKLLRKVHGGVAVLKANSGKYPELNYAERQQVDLEEKEEIAIIAASKVKDGMSIALNAGTTNEILAKSLLHHYSRLTVVTNSLTILSILRQDPNIQVILCGGTYNRKNNAFFGTLAEDFVKQFSVDIYFLAVSGVDITRGITDYSEEEAGMQRMMLRGAAEVIVLSAAKKINAVSLIFICGLADIDYIITDSSIAPHVVKEFREAGIQLVSYLESESE